MNKVVLILLVLFVIFSLYRTEKYTDNPKSDINDDEFDLSKYKKTDLSITHDLMQEIILQTNEQVSKRTGLCTYIIETISADIYENIDSENTGKICKCMFMVVKYGNKGFDFGFAVSAIIRIVNMGPRYEIKEFDDQNTVEMEKELLKIIGEMELKTLRTDLEDMRLKKFQKKYNQLQNEKKEMVDEKPVVSILSLRTQPINIKIPSNEGVFTNDIPKQEFLDYTLVRESEINYLKNNTNLLVEKEILSSHVMYDNNVNITVTENSE